MYSAKPISQVIEDQIEHGRAVSRQGEEVALEMMTNKSCLDGADLTG